MKADETLSHSQPRLANNWIKIEKGRHDEDGRRTDTEMKRGRWTDREVGTGATRAEQLTSDRQDGREVNRVKPEGGNGSECKTKKHVRSSIHTKYEIKNVGTGCFLWYFRFSFKWQLPLFTTCFFIEKITRHTSN